MAFCAVSVSVLVTTSLFGETADPWVKARHELVQLIAEGVKDPRVLQSVATTPRHLFVPEELRHNAYVDMTLPIGGGVTISPPYVVAFMTEQLDPQPNDRVLEIGTGSGYQAAILSPLVKEVYSIEIIEDLGRQADERLQRLGYKNVHVQVGDGFKGWPEHAPFDKIIVTCSPEEIPQPLVEQLKEGGRMLIPLGKRYQQSLCLVTKRSGQLERQFLESTFFVPMTGFAEEVRTEKQDDGSPVLANGSFELFAKDSVPANWYYLRQAEIISDSNSPHGENFLRLTNDTVGRAAQVVQNTGLDGQRFKSLEVSVMVRTNDITIHDDSFAGINVYFFDRQRREIGEARLGPWQGSTPWSEYSTCFLVPRETQIIMIGAGLYGATGELDIDHLQMHASSSSPKGPFD
ncbi:MAG: protein-L-isoaspartate(D-aspartate) O-methyltransferase [Planctomycetaceae bacterium]|nr:protein-L-isoaspartate(D-aspartate) O-methyltransferase [Planctomycetaceae bacterium]